MAPYGSGMGRVTFEPRSLDRLLFCDALPCALFAVTAGNPESLSIRHPISAFEKIFVASRRLR